MKIIRTILESHFFSEKPPILIDIGASGEINKKWKSIAPYCICIAFDADERDFQINESTNSQYKKLISFNRIVTADKVTHTDFYLTSSPYCSSALQPDHEKLRPWLFRSLFFVEKLAFLPAITLIESLNQTSIHYVDWFKTDTQGTDLRLFKSLPDELSRNILMAEFEPGIMDAYKGEDKLHLVMKEMEKDNFWLSSMDVKGTQRLNADYVQAIGKSITTRVIKKSPCWAEVTYLRQPFPGTERQLLLLFVFAVLEKQFGFALEVIDYANEKFSNTLFRDCKKAVLAKLLNDKWKVPVVIIKRQIKKLFSKIDD
jgi:hypothetical protein